MSTALEIAKKYPSVPVYLVNNKKLVDSLNVFRDNFNGDVMYAVKCNPHPRILESLLNAGLKHFDVASYMEISKLRDFHIDDQYYDTTLHFMHPVKSSSAIRYAYLNTPNQNEITDYVIDHPDELKKINRVIGDDPNVCIFLRVSTKHFNSLLDLSSKFGADSAAKLHLYNLIKEMGYKFGITFHVGTQCITTNAWTYTINKITSFCNKNNITLDALDIGGGFPCNYPESNAPDVKTILKGINEALNIPLYKNTRILAEPGRAIVAEAVSLLVKVELRKGAYLYLNDGVYGGLSELLSAGNNIKYPTKVIRNGEYITGDLKNFSVFGPTCDSLDVVPDAFILPDTIRENDYIEIGMIGAYSYATSSYFNGFHSNTFEFITE